MIYNNKSNLDLGIEIISKPNIPNPEREYDKEKINGRDGNYYKDLKTYKDIVITVSFNFIYDVAETFRNVRNWLEKKENNKLYFTDDSNFFYKVKTVEIETGKRILSNISKFDVNFICDPYMYFEDGIYSRELGNSLYNQFDVSKPIYVIKGEGVCYFTVNNTTIKANVGQELTINTELGLCYKDNTVNNNAISGSYTNLFLQRGNNMFGISAGFRADIIPNWRRL